MSKTPDFFRDFGILPRGAAPPPGPVRSYLPAGHVIGQYIATGGLLVLALGMAVLFAFTMPMPGNIIAPLVVLPIALGLAYLIGRRDYVWIELDGDTIRAKHLYTQRIVERSIDEVEELVTMVLMVRTLATAITDAWLGRIKGVEIRFRDKKTPLRVLRSDPAMRNAKELIEAIVYRMAQEGEIDAQVINMDGQPLVRRIYWK